MAIMQKHAPNTIEVDFTKQNTAPDGGINAWLVVAGTWCVSFCTYGWINSIGVFQEYYQNNLFKEYSPSSIAWIPSLQVFFMTFMGPIVGALSDRYGPRWMILAGSLLHVTGLMMASISHEYYQILLSQGVCSALGISIIFQPALACVSGFFDKKRGIAFGILATGSSAGGVCFPILVNHLIQKVGFGWSMRISSFVILVLLVTANLTVKAHNKPQPHFLSLRQAIRPFGETPFLLLFTGLVLFTFGFYVPINYIAVEAVAAGMSPHVVQYMVAIINGGSLFGRLGSGLAGDAFGHYNVFIVVCYITAVLILGIWLPAPTTAVRIVFACLFGFFSGAYVAMIPSLVVQISPLDEHGFRIGLAFFSQAAGGLTTNPINGAILGRHENWTNPKIFAGVLCLTGTTLVLAARVRKTGFRLLTVF